MKLPFHRRNCCEFSKHIDNKVFVVMKQTMNKNIENKRICKSQMYDNISEYKQKCIVLVGWEVKSKKNSLEVHRKYPPRIK